MAFCITGKHLFSLAHAASGYHKVLEENRKLYNQVQDLKGTISSHLVIFVVCEITFIVLTSFFLLIGSIRIYCRVRPFLPGQLSGSTVGCIDDGHITILTPSKYGKEGCRSFNFNKVFAPSATQGY